MLGVALSDRNEETWKLPLLNNSGHAKYSNGFTDNDIMKEGTIVTKSTTNMGCCDSFSD